MRDHDRSEMLWDQQSGKWSDRGNNFWVREQYNGKWSATARYYFVWPEISHKEYAEHDTFEFDTEQEALAFVRSYLALRQNRLCAT
jgi:hypothetical protein